MSEHPGDSGGDLAGESGGAPALPDAAPAGAGAAAAAVSASYAPQALVWSQPRTVGAELCGPRAAHSTNVLSIGGRPSLVTFGGWDGRAGLTGLAVLDVESLTWSAPHTTGPALSARNNHATFVYGTRLYVHGGHDGSRWLADLACLETERWEWTLPPVAGVLPTPRACHTVTVLGRKAYMFGGYDGARCFNELEVLGASDAGAGRALGGRVRVAPRATGGTSGWLGVPRAR